jgi:phosphodiesterase/alkaline phosphatase D-like protein
MEKILIGIVGLMVVALIVGGVVFFANQPAPSNLVSNTTSSIATSTPSPVVLTPPSTSQAGAVIVVTGGDSIVSNSSVLVTGSVNPNGAPTTYWFEYGQTTSLEARSAAQAIGASFISITSPGFITGLQANTLYYFRIAAENRYGTVRGTTYSFKTNSNPPPQGKVPTVRTNPATNIVRTAADLHGQISTNGAPTTYWFEYGQNIDLGNAVAPFQSISSGSNSVSITLSGLKPLTKYYFRLNGQNQYGTVTGTILTFTTQGPTTAAPTVKTGTATNIATSSAILRGHINPNGAETTYSFEYGTDPLLKNILGAIPSLQPINGIALTAVATNVTNLTSNTKYYYRVVAKNQYGTTKGNIATFRTT